MHTVHSDRLPMDSITMKRLESHFSLLQWSVLYILCWELQNTATPQGEKQHVTKMNVLALIICAKGSLTGNYTEHFMLENFDILWHYGWIHRGKNICLFLIVCDLESDFFPFSFVCNEKI